jgi:TolB-like protein/Tfp pilus assembly protein PilF
MSVGVMAVLATAGMAGLSMRSEHPQLSPRASIIVLPIRNSSGDPGQDYIADAVTDDLTTDLSRLCDTLVIARATAFAYKGKPVDARAIGREFSVRYMLEGSIGSFGTRVLANAELIDTDSATAIWADRFETEITNLAELYDSVTGRIAASLNLQLVRAEYRRAVARRETDPDAADLRLRAMAYVIENETRENYFAARKSLEASLALEPENAESLSQLALVLVREFLHNWNDITRQDVVERAATYLDKAIANFANAPPGVRSMAYLTEGYILRVKGDNQGALEAFDRALQLNPNLALALARKAIQLVFLGHPKDALDPVEKAFKVSPHDPDLWNFHYIKGLAYFALGEYDTAINWLEQSVRLQPGLWFNRAFLISAYAHRKRFELHEAEAERALSQYREKFKDWPLSRIQDHFNKIEPQPSSGFSATLQELYNGLAEALGTHGDEHPI